MIPGFNNGGGNYMKEWFRARNVWGAALDTLSDESTGKLMKAVWKYTRTGQIAELQGPESALFALILFSLEQDEERDSEISRKRAASGAAGGRKKAKNKGKDALSAENPKRAIKSSAAAEAAANATEAKSGTDEAANATETKSGPGKVANASETKSNAEEASNASGTRSDTEKESTSAKAIFTTHEASYTTETGSDAEENTNRARTRYVTDEAPNAAEPEYAVNEAPNAANVANANNKNQNQNQNQIQNQSQSQNQNQNQKQSKKTNKEKAQEREVRFERFWAVYPRKAAKAAARRAFDRINPDEALMEIMTTAIEKWKKTEQWNDNDGRYIPHPATWLNQRRWEDELPTPVVTKPTVIAQQYAQRDYSKVQEELMAEQDREMEEWLRSCG